LNFYFYSRFILNFITKGEQMGMFYPYPFHPWHDMVPILDEF